MTDASENRVYGQRTGYPRFYKANLTLQAKVGKGDFDSKAVENAQQAMNIFAPDVSDILRSHVDNLNGLLQDAATAPVAPEDFLPDVSRDVMQLKAIGSMFKHPVIGQLSAVLLQFLDTTHRLDSDSRAIIAAHNQSVSVLLHNPNIDKLVSVALVSELQAACDRYIAKAAAAKL